MLGTIISLEDVYMIKSLHYKLLIRKILTTINTFFSLNFAPHLSSSGRKFKTLLVRRETINKFNRKKNNGYRFNKQFGSNTYLGLL